MKRLHVHVSVDDVAASIRFYNTLFAAGIEDPQGIQWETFLTTGESTVYGNDPVAEARVNACCGPHKAA
jgi:hypothetical protein